MLIAVLVKNIDFRKCGKWETKMRKSTQKQREIIEQLLIWLNLKTREYFMTQKNNKKYEVYKIAKRTVKNN